MTSELFNTVVYIVLIFGGFLLAMFILMQLGLCIVDYVMKDN